MLADILIRLLALNSLLCNALGSDYNITSCKSCLWLRTDSQPSLGLAFLKTRKSGSTNFEAFFANWLLTNNCYSKDLHVLGLSERGIEDGRLSVQASNERPMCPYVNLMSMENMCWDIDKLQMLPPRGKRHGSPLSLFTILREPIERIGSQAFYSREVVGIQTIIQFIKRSCLSHLLSREAAEDDAYDSYESCKQLQSHHTSSSPSPRSKKCSCLFEAHRLAMAELKSNDTLWFDWFEHSRRQVFYVTNLYKKNYYLERMFGGNSLLYNEYYNTTFHAALRCLDRGCDEGAANLNVLHELSAMTICVKNIHPTKITEHILPMAKQLLRSHIDFIIMEKYGDYSTSGAIASFLRTDQQSVSRIIRDSHHGAGKFTSSSSYRDLMPPSVVKYLEAENAWDIEFYHYAVKVFEERAATEGWNHNY